MDAKQSELDEARLEQASSEEIRNGIRGTRREMDETLDELGDRLHPRHLLDDLIDIFRSGSQSGSESRQRIVHGSKRLGQTVAHQIREHPLPALLAGVAIARWIYEATESEPPLRGLPPEESLGYAPGDWSPEEPRESGPGWSEKAQGAMAGLKSRAGSAAAKAGEKVSTATSAVGEKVSEAASATGHRISGAAEAGWERVREGGRTLGHYSHEGRDFLSDRASQMRDRFRRTSEEFPLPVGGAFLAAGVLVGLLLPRTEQEDEWMGEAADQFKDQSRAKGEDLMERGKAVAAKAAASAMDEAEARGLTPGELVDKAGRVASEAVKAGKEAARQEGIAPSTLKEAAGTVAKTAVETAKQEGKKQTGEGKRVGT